MAKTELSRKHHYVPKAILRQFSTKANSVYYISKETRLRGAELRNIDSIFRRMHYNSSERQDGSKNDTLEKFFSHELDNYIPAWLSVFKGVLSGRDLEFKDTASRRRFVQFFYNHLKRTPEFMEPIVESVAEETFHSNLAEEFESRFRPLTKKENCLMMKDLEPELCAIAACATSASNPYKS